MCIFAAQASGRSVFSGHDIQYYFYPYHVAAAQMIADGAGFITETVFSDPYGSKLEMIRSAVEAGTALAAAAQAFLDTVDENIGANSQSLDAKHGAVAASLDQIATSLAAIEADLLAMATTDEGQADAA